MYKHIDTDQFKARLQARSDLMDVVDEIRRVKAFSLGECVEWVSKHVSYRLLASSDDASRVRYCKALVEAYLTRFPEEKADDSDLEAKIALWEKAAREPIDEAEWLDAKIRVNEAMAEEKRLEAEAKAKAKHEKIQRSLGKVGKVGKE